MKLSLGDAAQRFDALSLRERALVALAGVAVVWLVWDSTVLQALERRLTTARNEVSSLEHRIVTETNDAEQLRRSLAEDPNRRLAERAHALEQDIAALDVRLESLVGGFVEPSMMPVLLEDVVTHHRGVSLQRVANLPVEPVRRDATGEPVPGLFRHAMRVELRGDYFAVRDYLRELESAPWRLAWRSVAYRVDAYPQANVVVEVETMSRDKNWLGV